MMKYKNIFFDFDGTISRSGTGIIHSLQYMFNEMGIKAPEEKELYRFIGPPVRYLLKEYGIEGEENDRAYAVFREYYAKKGIYEMELYDGIKELLQCLSKAGAILHIATGKRGPQAQIALEYLNVGHYFKHVFGAEIEYNIIEKTDIIKKAIQTIGVFPEDPIMVGDRGMDVTGGRENGFATIGVLYGYGDEKEIRVSRPDHIAKNVAQLKQILLEGE